MLCSNCAVLTRTSGLFGYVTFVLKRCSGFWEVALLEVVQNVDIKPVRSAVVSTTDVR